MQQSMHITIPILSFFL